MYGMQEARSMCAIHKYFSSILESWLLHFAIAHFADTTLLLSNIREKTEPVLLAIPVATALILATAILSMKSFNISASTIRCWIAEGEPYLCEKKGEFAGNGGRGLGQCTQLL
jgi:hypothetical protein